MPGIEEKLLREVSVRLKFCEEKRYSTVSIYEKLLEDPEAQI